MPNYDFKTDSGDVVEVFFSMRDVPAIGSTIDHPDHGRITRIAYAAQVSPNFSTGTYPVVSHALPRNIEGAPSDKRGRPIILNRQHERELCARHGYQRRED